LTVLEETKSSTGQSAVPPSLYRPPTGTSRTLALPGSKAKLLATADWLLVREHGVPTAEVFFTSYVKDAGRSRESDRPITFLFNGGPGAASAFLHMGTAGPKRVKFSSEGRALPPPVQIVDNAEHWLEFTDLVFVDPVGTGLSRTVAESRLEQHGIDSEDEKREKRTKDLPEAKKPFFKIKRDIDVLCEFVLAFLSRESRWQSPVYIAGESYGGFRVGKLMRALPERGVGLSGAIMVSPAVDFLAITGVDYDINPWVNSVPTMALTARLHGKARGRFASMAPDRLREAAETFAESDLASLLMRGERTPAAVRSRTLGTLAEMIGLPEELVARAGGRVRIEIFTRELLRERGLVCGYYDAAITGANIFPDREGEPNPDPTLAGITAAFTAGINTLLRRDLGLSTQREYKLISEEVWKHWADDQAQGYYERHLHCADDMRYGMGMNPHLRLFITHGWYDLVTTYFSSAQAVSLLQLPSELRERVSLANYDGGHMFYTWDASRKAFLKDVSRLYRAAK
jgi:carboxypeptidase C (cathepsin A)